MQPLVNYVSNFDATLDYKLEFTYLGSEYIVTNHVEIREDRFAAKYNFDDIEDLGDSLF